MNRNTGVLEQIGSLITGTALLLFGLKRGGLSGTVAAVAGGGLLAHGLSGNSRVYGALGINTSGQGCDALLHRLSHVTASIAIDRPPAEVFSFWRDLSNLPKFMLDVESVEELGEKKSRWHARGPLDAKLYWDAEIVEERAGELIRWRTIESESNLQHDGAVYFSSAPGCRGTILRVEFDWTPPAGVVGAAAVKLLPQDPARRIREDLRRFRQLLEAGEIARNGLESGKQKQISASRAASRDAVEEAGIESFPASDAPAFSQG